MRKLILGVALAGVAAVAVLAQSQLKDSDDGAVIEAETGRRNGAGSGNGAAIATATVEAPRTGESTSAAPGVTVEPAAPGSAAETRAPEPPVVVPTAGEEQGAAILRRAASAYKTVSSMKADFTQKRDNPILGSTTISRGTLYQKKPDRFLMKFSDPAGDVIVSDGRYFWLYYPSADKRQVMRAPAQVGAAGGVDLQAQFLGDPLTRFSHTYHGKQDMGGRSTHVLTMVPKQNAGYKSLKVWIDDKDALVRRFVLTENNGLVQEFTLSGLTLNPALSNDLFKFTPPADAHIIENL
jgi:outer membrane lipoprotein carrier protein